MSNFRINGGRPGESVCFSIFYDFCKLIIIHLIYMVSPCLSPESGPSYDILNLADVVDVFVTNSIPQSIVTVTHLKVLNLYEGLLLLLHFLIERCPVFYPVHLFSYDVQCFVTNVLEVV